jgi:hypothetical protein
MNVVAIDSAATLERRADRIRSLMTSMVKNTIAIGAELDKAREQFPLGPRNRRMGWQTWLKKEFNISLDWAARLILVNRKFAHRLIDNQPMPTLHVLDYLAKSTTPGAAVDEILERVQKGEKISKAKAKKIARKTLPGPKAANKMARESGKPVEASDGYVYLGATDEQAKESKQRLTVVYALKEAIATIAATSQNMSAVEFLEYGMPHQLWKPDEEQQIEQTLQFLKDLEKAWPKRRDEIREYFKKAKASRESKQ